MLFALLLVHFYLSDFHPDGYQVDKSPSGWNQEPGTRRQPHGGFSGAAPGCLDVIQGLFQLQEQRGGQLSHQGLGCVCPFPCLSVLLSHPHRRLQGLGPPLSAGHAVMRKADAVHASAGLTAESRALSHRRLRPGGCSATPGVVLGCHNWGWGGAQSTEWRPGMPPSPVQ